MASKIALITGVTGQDGSYLCELLLSKGYKVVGLKRRSSSFNTGRIDHLYSDHHDMSSSLTLVYGDMTDTSSLYSVIKKYEPDEIYNLAAQSHVAVSFETPEYTANCDALGPLRILESVRSLGLSTKTRIYQASTSELYGGIYSRAQNEKTPFYPRSPYGVAKQYAYWITINYREAYNLYASNGILFNHESPRRGETFVTRKITRAFAEIQKGNKSTLYLGNLDALRDWGHARDYAEAMWLILQHNEPDDFVISTGHQITVRRFVELCAEKMGWGGITWRYSGENEVGSRNDTDEIVVRIDPIYYRPTEVSNLLGDFSKARRILGWSPRTTVEELIEEMVNSDLNAF